MKYFLLLFFLIPFGLVAQQLPYTSAFSSNHFAWNPAMTAAWSSIETQAIYQQEWLGFQEAPTTISAGIQYPMLNQNMSLGAQLTRDQTGPFQQTGVSLMYAYQLKLSYHDRLAIGMMVNRSQFRFDATNLLAFDLDDTTIGDGEGLSSKTNIGIGVYYTSVHPDELDDPYLFAGLSAMQAIPGDLFFSTLNETANFDRSLHGFGLIGYHIAQDFGFLEPSLQVLYVPNNITHLQGNLLYEMYDTFWAGLSIDSAFRVGLQLGFIIPNIGDGALRIGSMGSYNVSSRGADQGLSIQALIGYQYEL